jgi:hypothetical protein
MRLLAVVQIIQIILASLYVFKYEYSEAKNRDCQLADHALYECTRERKYSLELKPSKNGDCEFVAVGE